jgi:hypothetical protein
MKNTIIATLLFLLSSKLYGQKNEGSIYFNNSTGGRIDNYSTIGLGYYKAILPKLKLGINYETPLIQNTNTHGFSISNGISTLNYNYTDKIKLRNFDLLLKYSLLNKETYEINILGGITLQNYNITNIPLVEIKDLVITTKTEVNSNKLFLLPKLGINGALKLYKSLYLSGLIYNRNTSFLKSKVIYTNNSIETTTDNSSSGSGISTITIEEQVGVNIGLIFKF